MSIPLVVNDICEAILATFVDGQTSITKLHYTVSTVGGSPATTADAAQAVDGAFTAVLKQLIFNDADYRGVSFQRLWPGPVAIADIYTGTAGAGSAGATGLPKQSCGLITWRTGLIGRPFRGRTYMPFPASAADTGDGLPTAAYVTLLGTFAVNYLTPLAISASGRTATLVPAIYHRALHTADRILTSLQRTAWATQRRRGDYGRANPPPF